MALTASAKVITFIVTRERAAAKAFYQDVLGFRVINEDDFAVVFDLNGTMLRISTSENHVAQQHTVLGWEVPDIVEAVRSLREKNVTFRVYDGMGQDEHGVWKPPGQTTKVAWFNDLDGNLLSLTEF